MKNVPSQLIDGNRGMEPGHPGFHPSRRQLLGGSASLALSALLAACSMGQSAAVTAPTPTESAAVSPQPQIAISPRSALIDAPVALRITGLPPQQEVSLAATVTSAAGTYRSFAAFLSDVRGAVDVASQAPLSGTYSDPDAMGLFWSMTLAPGTTPASPSPTRVFAVSPPWAIAFTASVGGTMVASATIERQFVDPAVTRIPVSDQGLVGTLFLPAGPGPHPGILSWGGSSGGYAESQAALLASHGYAALALAYFGVPPLPENLLNIPLEYFETAITWLQAHAGVNGERLAVVGTSRGGELALLVGATFPQIKAVVGYVPSGVVWPGNDNSGRPQPGPAWIYRGMPLPFVTTARSYFGTRYADPTDLARATIPVEQINGPVLLISGEDDALWPSTQLAQVAMDRLAQHRHPYPDKHLHYAGAGHLIGQPYRPTTALTAGYNPTVGTAEAYGGNAKGYAAAAADSWPQALSFLRDSIGN